MTAKEQGLPGTPAWMAEVLRGAASYIELRASGVPPHTGHLRSIATYIESALASDTGGRGVVGGWARTKLRPHEAACESCGRAVWDGKDPANCIGFLAPCGKRVARGEDCGTVDCIAALRAQPAGGGGVRDREADRARFPDADFNRWLDEGISDCGHIVWHQIASIECAWAAWDYRPYYAKGRHPLADAPDDELFATPPAAAEAVVTEAVLAAALCAPYGDGDVSDMLRGGGDEETAIIGAAIRAAIAAMREGGGNG